MLQPDDLQPYDAKSEGDMYVLRKTLRDELLVRVAGRLSPNCSTQGSRAAKLVEKKDARSRLRASRESAALRDGQLKKQASDSAEVAPQQQQVVESEWVR